MGKTIIEVPVSIGDTIFVIPSRVNFDLNIVNGHEEDNRVYEQKIDCIRWWNNNKIMIYTCDSMYCVSKDTQDEIWFLDKCNAEHKLNQLKEQASYLKD